MHRAVSSMLIVLMAGCSVLPRRPPGIHGGKLAACPPTPNCVSSDDTDPAHRVEPLQIAGSPLAAWEELRALLTALPRTRVVTATTSYLHAEVRSRLFGFVDDLELQLRSRERIIAVRSAARRGRSDLGVNRARLEEIRARLQERGVVR